MTIPARAPASAGGAGGADVVAVKTVRMAKAAPITKRDGSDEDEDSDSESESDSGNDTQEREESEDHVARIRRAGRKAPRASVGADVAVAVATGAVRMMPSIPKAPRWIADADADEAPACSEHSDYGRRRARPNLPQRRRPRRRSRLQERSPLAKRSPASTSAPYAQGTGPQEGKDRHCEPKSTETAAPDSGPQEVVAQDIATPEAAAEPDAAVETETLKPQSGIRERNLSRNPSQAVRIRKLPTHLLRPRTRRRPQPPPEPVTVVLNASRSGPAQACRLVVEGEDDHHRVRIDHVEPLAPARGSLLLRLSRARP